jgi:hypothetical protein
MRNFCHDTVIGLFYFFLPSDCARHPHTRIPAKKTDSEVSLFFQKRIGKARWGDIGQMVYRLAPRIAD